MSTETNTSKTKICPVCGTRLSDTATRCLVCGSELEAKAESKSTSKVNSKRLPEITLSLPLALGLLALFITLGAVVVFFALRSNKPVPETAQGEITSTLTPTETLTPTITSTPTLQPTLTPLPPLEYTVVEGDVCSSIAAIFGVSIQSIILENNLSANCEIYPGKVLLIPQPTPTASPEPSATLDEVQSTDAACEKIQYQVKENDTLSSISQTYNVSMAAIKEYNGLVSDIVFEGQYLTIPLCERQPTPGPTPTPTPPPPYPAPNLLLPLDGAPFSLSNDAISLQWASVGELRDNEAYAITIEDVTTKEEKRTVEYTVDTKFILPVTFRPTDNVPHIIRWWVSVVRQIGSTENGDPIWEQAGLISEKRVFSWIGTIIQPTPVP